MLPPGHPTKPSHPATKVNGRLGSCRVDSTLAVSSRRTRRSLGDENASCLHAAESKSTCAPLGQVLFRVPDEMHSRTPFQNESKPTERPLTYIGRGRRTLVATLSVHIVTYNVRTIDNTHGITFVLFIVRCLSSYWLGYRYVLHFTCHNCCSNNRLTRKIKIDNRHDE